MRKKKVKKKKQKIKKMKRNEEEKEIHSNKQQQQNRILAQLLSEMTRQVHNSLPEKATNEMTTTMWLKR